MKHKVKAVQRQTAQDTRAFQGSEATALSIQEVPSPTSEQIRQRAQEIHMAQGGRGPGLMDWLQAERELKAEISRQQKTNPVVPEKSFPPKHRG